MKKVFLSLLLTVIVGILIGSNMILPSSCDEKENQTIEIMDINNEQDISAVQEISSQDVESLNGEEEIPIAYDELVAQKEIPNKDSSEEQVKEETPLNDHTVSEYPMVDNEINSEDEMRPHPLLNPDGSLDEVAFNNWKTELQERNDKISNPEPKHDSRFVVVSQTGIVFSYPNDWPQVMYLEEYTIVGALYEDSNENGLWNTQEPGVPNAPVHVYWGAGTTREIMPDGEVPLTGSAAGNRGIFRASWNITETQEGPHRLNFTYNGEYTFNGSAFYEHNPGTQVPGEAWLARAASTWPPAPQEDFEAEIWHQVSIDVDIGSPDIDDIYVGDQLTVNGNLQDRDLGWGLSTRAVHIKFDANYVTPDDSQVPYEMTSSTGTFSFQWTIPAVISPGIHTLSIEYKWDFIDPDSGEYINDYYVSNSSSIQFGIHRNLHFEVEDKVVYRTDTINISGRILDDVGEGPDTIIGNTTFRYEIMIEWGDPSDPYYESGDTNPDLLIRTGSQSGDSYLYSSGEFSTDFRIKESQPLTLVKVTFNFRLARDNPLDYMYYGEVSDYVMYTVKARTVIELKVVDDEDGEELTELTRTGPASTFQIVATLLDKDLLEKAGQISPIQGATISLDGTIGGKGLTGSGATIGSYTTDALGRISVSQKLDIFDPTGPLLLRAIFNGNQWHEGFDTDGYDEEGNYYGLVVDITATTTIEIEPGSGIKGENVVIKGKLKDDTGLEGVANETINFFWKKTRFADDGSSIGSVKTDQYGKFIFTGFQIPKTQFVGVAYVKGKFTGSSKVLHTKDKKMHYTLDDAYAASESSEVKFNVSAYIHISIDPSILNGSTYTRGETITISGGIEEMFQGKVQYPKTYVKNIRINAYFQSEGGNSSQKFMLSGTSSDNYGQYDLGATVPESLSPGVYLLKMHFQSNESEENKKYLTKSEYLDSRRIFVTTDTEIDVLEHPPDIDPELSNGIDIGYTKSDKEESGYRFVVLLREKNTLSVEPVPISNQKITLTIKLRDENGVNYINETTRTTDDNGKAIFNFTHFQHRDGARITIEGLSADGNWYLSFPGKNIPQTIEGKTSKGWIGSTYPADLQRNQEKIHFEEKPIVYPPPEFPELDWWLENSAALVGLILFILLLIAGMILLALYIRKRRRIAGIKRIIKRAADQLVAGNEYTAVIFKSYQKLGYHLRKYGYLRREAETFREFEDAVREALPIDKASLNRFLTILEEARYSSHEIGERQRDGAVTELRNIESSLSSIQLDDDEAMKKLEETEEEFVETEILLNK